MKIYYKFLLLIVWMIVIFLFSSEVADTSSSRSGVIVDLLSSAVSWPQELLTFLTRKAAHITIYFILGILMFSVVKEYVPNVKRALWLSVVFVLCYAIFDEVHQLFVPGRSGELRDVLIDTVAGAMGIFALYLGGNVFRSKKQSESRDIV